MDTLILLAEILLPLPLDGTFTYRISREMEHHVKPGVRVVVPFGKKKIYTGIVINLHSDIPQNYQPKYILSVVDEKPIVNSIQLSFWKWISKYYLSHLGEVMNAALPSAYKLASETKIILNPTFDKNYSRLNDKEYLIIEALELQEVITLSEAAKIVDQIKVISLIKNLIEKEAVQLLEEIKDEYKPKIEKYVTISQSYRGEKKLGELFDELNKKAYKQLEVVMAYLKLSEFYGDGTPKDVKLSLLVKQSKASHSQVKSLEKKGVLKIFEKRESRLKKYNVKKDVDSIIFSEAQNLALSQIKEEFKQHPVTLLHGVTGSGKTEIYIKLIDETIKAGKQVLYLLPEIALTSQIINRLSLYFGDKVGVYHSKYNPQERVEIWENINGDEGFSGEKYQIILGPRSALFLPYNNLGLIIIDEEHDSSYKQQNPAPRYNGRDTAIYLASLHNAKTLLGTATPSIESYFNTKSKKYGLVELNKRFGDLELPEVFVADLKVATRRKEMKSMFSPLLIKRMEEALAKKEQIILFQNRRGFSLRVECNVCNWIPQCKNCDVSMTYHKKSDLLKCHYCGHSERVPSHCAKCGSSEVFMHGFGTEKIEEELKIIFPDHITKRMDLDTTRSKRGHQQIIHEFETGKIDILVGTQMVTKGLDFNNVSIVGVLNADGMLNFPDFRAFEKGYQLMAQVSGRAGRKKKRGTVIIQSFNPYHDAIRYVIDNDYQAMYSSQIIERRNFKYPPFYRFVIIQIRDKSFDKLNKASYILGRDIRAKFGERVLGPEYPLVARVRNQYIKQLIIKLERSTKLPLMKAELLRITERFKGYKDYKSVRISIDVDPI
ncbi:MAG: primosomal protein N' [Bacteroidota bacterium]|nr:primosomal protein N' [Bacteroidota bacterium]